MSHCDLFVIGGGSGGVRAARLAAATGARVVLAEKSKLGGTCVNVGCVPKKLYYYAAGFNKEWQIARAFARPQASLGALDWAGFVERKNAEVARLNGVYARLLKGAGAQVVFDEARLVGGKAGAWLLRAGKAEFCARRVLLAVGGAPARPKIKGAELAAVSDDLFALQKIPPSVALFGGGYIALEFAGIFAGLGAKTTLCYRAPLPMRGLDEDLRQRLANGLAANGVCLRPNAAPVEFVKAGDKTRIVMSDGGDDIVTDLAALATGRRPATAGLGLEAAGLAAQADGTLAVDDNFMTAADGVYAIGDLLQTPALTPVATAEAESFVARVFGNNAAAKVDYESLPTAVFSRPSVAVCGLSQKEAARRKQKTAVYASAFKPMKGGFAGGGESYIKLIVEDADAANNHAGARVLGAQMLGDDAAEIMQGVAVAIAAGARKGVFDSTIGIHPSSAEEFVSLRATALQKQ